MLARLRDAAAAAELRFPGRYWHDAGLGPLGLHLRDRLEANLYEFCTPPDCWVFADTGGDGVHFGLLADAGRLTDESPVVVSVPCYPANVAVGGDLLDFLSLGCRRGYFALEQLAYDRAETVRAYTDPDWRPPAGWHEAVGFLPDAGDLERLAFLTGWFDLRPWADPGRFDVLESRYGDRLAPPAPPDL